MNELESANVFLQVVRSNGFTGAARALGRSASSLSRVIAGLEAHLGSQLFTRTTRSLHLTEAGALYRTHAEALVAASRAAHDALAELRGAVPRGHLRVAMPVSVGERLLAPHLPAFRARHPELRLAIDLSDRNVALVQGGFDLAIRVGRPPESSLRALLLGRIPIVLVASPAYLERRGVPRRPRDLAKHDCITVGPHLGPTDWTFHRGARKERVGIEGVVETSSATFAGQLAVAGMGLVRTTKWLIKDELARGALVEVMAPWSCDHPRHGGVPIYVLYAQAGTATPPRKSRVFVELVKEIMAMEVARG
ncbi:MAG: LysR family transcriptional regulator [Labilithrix sp.]|nr:LysR family transcriptional regulator [Labilithrix sp.]MCW5814552.1 LysR family transcriptional regulator [Labilithrix sp.]